MHALGLPLGFPAPVTVPLLRKLDTGRRHYYQQKVDYFLAETEFQKRTNTSFIRTGNRVVSIRSGLGQNSASGNDQGQAQWNSGISHISRERTIRKADYGKSEKI